jgi:hypothetical protein
MCSPAKPGAAVPTVFIDNARARVTESRLPKRGDATGWHRHEYDYVVVPLMDGFLELVDAAGKITRGEMKMGVPYFRQAGVEHDVLNGNDYEFAFVETEFLEPPRR